MASGYVGMQSNTGVLAGKSTMGLVALVVLCIRRCELCDSKAGAVRRRLQVAIQKVKARDVCIVWKIARVRGEHRCSSLYYKGAGWWGSKQTSLQVEVG